MNEKDCFARVVNGRVWINGYGEFGDDVVANVELLNRAVHALPIDPEPSAIRSIPSSKGECKSCGGSEVLADPNRFGEEVESE